MMYGSRMRQLPMDIEIDVEMSGIDNPIDRVFDRPGRYGIKAKRLALPPTSHDDMAEDTPSPSDHQPDPEGGMFRGFAGGVMGMPPDPNKHLSGMMGDDQLMGEILRGLQSGKKSRMMKTGKMKDQAKKKKGMADDMEGMGGMNGRA